MGTERLLLAGRPDAMITIAFIVLVMVLVVALIIVGWPTGGNGDDGKY